ncbi:hypothetical protein HPB49_001673 [Dermacentor silvarum]|uniref:Uncharacterized protein n=1 Tax=Dermacentor silvarum TaxID=543639 RepID=A0ACB8C6V4_DERSI|nr:hypothetical protein HPB49_001673 [Dermacentor silvarum]
MAILGTVIAAVAVTTVIFWLLKRRSKLRLFKDLGIPGPKPYFLWGNLKQMDHRRVEAFVQWRKDHGKLFGVYVGSEPFLVITDPEMAHECFVKQAAIFQDRPTSFVDAEPFKSSLFQLGGSMAVRMYYWCAEVDAFPSPVTPGCDARSRSTVALVPLAH